MIEKLKMFFWGIMAALGALAMESLVMVFSSMSTSLVSAESPPWLMPVGVFIEELFALVLIGKLLSNSTDKKNIFARTLCFGMGFALPEILLNFANYPLLSQEILLSYLGLLLIHTATAGIFGYYFSHQEGWRPGIIFFFFLAVATHLAFNFCVLFDFSFWMSLGLPILVIFISFLALKMPIAKGSLPIQKI